MKLATNFGLLTHTEDRSDGMCSSDTRIAMLNLLNTLGEGAFELEALADNLAQAALDIAEADQVQLVLGKARQHRVKAIELRGRFAVLSKEYDMRFHADL